jgi:hypothetical protein
VIINDLDIPGVIVPEFEGDPPWPAGRNCPLASAVALQPLQTHGCKAAQVFEAAGLVKQSQAPASERLVEPGKSVLSLFRKALGGPVGP